MQIVNLAWRQTNFIEALRRGVMTRHGELSQGVHYGCKFAGADEHIGRAVDDG
jgi:hypothetical protein